MGASPDAGAVLDPSARRGGGRRELSFDIAIADEDGRVLAAIDGFTIAIVDAAAPLRPAVELAEDSASEDVDVRHDDYLFSPDEALGLMDALLRQDQADHVVLSRRPLDKRLNRIDRYLQDDEPAPEVEDGSLGDLTPVEATLTRMWRSALGQSHVSPDDDFFAIGGNSLLAVQMVSRIRREFGATLSGRVLIETRRFEGWRGPSIRNRPSPTDLPQATKGRQSCAVTWCTSTESGTLTTPSASPSGARASPRCIHPAARRS